MWLSVAFPTCPRCNNNANKCYHKGCPKGAKHPMEIDPDTAFVRCPTCDKKWGIKESNYFCSCGYSFSANEVSDEINAIIYNAKIIANELKRTAMTINRIHILTENEIETKAKNTIIKKFGTKVWNAIKAFLPTIFLAVKSWLDL